MQYLKIHKTTKMAFPESFKTRKNKNASSIRNRVFTFNTNNW
jgi:hypothetical protein